MNCYHLSLSKMSKKKKKRNFIWPLKVLNYIVGKMKYYNDEYDTDMDTRTKLPFQISYAMSIHKAQGLEFDSVKVVITKESDEQITKNIFYTAVDGRSAAFSFAGSLWNDFCEYIIMLRIEVMTRIILLCMT